MSQNNDDDDDDDKGDEEEEEDDNAHGLKVCYLSTRCFINI